MRTATLAAVVRIEATERRLVMSGCEEGWVEMEIVVVGAASDTATELTSLRRFNLGCGSLDNGSLDSSGLDERGTIGAGSTDASTGTMVGTVGGGLANVRFAFAASLCSRILNALLLCNRTWVRVASKVGFTGCTTRRCS